MNDNDIHMDIVKFMEPGLWGISEITLTHLPTGLTATARCANQLKARAGALRVLQAKVDYYNETGRDATPMTQYEPALAQPIEGPNHSSTGRPRWARAIYAADGTLLDVIQYDEAFGYPVWVENLGRMPAVKVSAGEFATWMDRAIQR